MVYEARRQSMAWMETDYSKYSHFQWKIRWRLEHLGALGIVGEIAPFVNNATFPFRGEHLLLFLAQTVARQTVEQRQYRPHRGSEPRAKPKSKTIGSCAAAPPLPEHDLDPPRFARKALEHIMQDWRAVRAMIMDACRAPGDPR